MLFVLRQLRRLELRQRSGRYFLYAIGETVLIVVGILIALQIQNWNQQRLDKIEEGYLLEELIDNLNLEAERWKIVLKLMDKRLEDYQSIRDFIENGTGSPETFNEDITSLVGTTGLNPATSAYESMKNGRIGFSSRELKAELIQYYDFMQKSIASALDKQDTLVSNQVEPLFAKYLKAIHGSRNTGTTAVPKDIDDPEFQEAMLGLVVMFEPRVRSNQERIETLLERNREILTLVEQELEELR